MRQAPGESVQKLCPSCSTLAYTSERRCPWCGASYRRRRTSGLVALMLVQTLLLLGGVAALLVLAGREAEDRFDRRVDRVERDIDESFEEVEDSVREELDRRLPEDGAP
jgi:hypothetical protein